MVNEMPTDPPKTLNMVCLAMMYYFVKKIMIQIFQLLNLSIFLYLYRGLLLNEINTV